MKKVVMAVILILVLAFSATAFAEMAVDKVFKAGNRKAENGKIYFAETALVCIDGYVFVYVSQTSAYTQFFEKGPNGTSAPKTCDMGK